jgi:hypothetical protein
MASARVPKYPYDSRMVLPFVPDFPAVTVFALGDRDHFHRRL